MHSVPLFSPKQLKSACPLSDAAATHIESTRKRITQRLTDGFGPRLVVVGPCSIHSETAALNYAELLAPLVRRYESDLLIVMRTYLEKPRTTVGWKGFVYDPALSGEGDLANGLKRSRSLLCQLAENRIPLATEILEPLTVPYLEDCFTWGAIGARTTESQVHRQIVSGLNMPVGFKNGTDGNVQVALSAMQSAASSHTLLGVDTDGQISLQTTLGNPNTHVILRGGASGPNYSKASVNAVLQSLPAGSRPQLMVDCAHGNSGKDPKRQPMVAQAVAGQFAHTDVDVLGVMLESHVREGTQPVRRDAHPHQSVTDPCLGFAETARVLEHLALVAACTGKRPVGRSRAKRKASETVRPVVSRA